MLFLLHIRNVFITTQWPCVSSSLPYSSQPISILEAQLKKQGEWKYRVNKVEKRLQKLQTFCTSSFLSQHDHCRRGRHHRRPQWGELIGAVVFHQRHKWRQPRATMTAQRLIIRLVHSSVAGGPTKSIETRRKWRARFVFYSARARESRGEILGRWRGVLVK